MIRSSGGRLAAFLFAVTPTLLFAQRVIPPDAPWRVEKSTSSVMRLANEAQKAAPAITEGQFVRRTGSLLVLNGQPFRFAGDNAYYLQADLVYGRDAGVNETLDKMVTLGMNVVRANAHNDNPPSSDPAAIQVSPGNYIEQSLVALDRSVALAKARNLRLILKLTNNWTAYGGIQRYVTWLLGRSPSDAEVELFYTDPTIRTWFKNYIQMIVGRKNMVTGILYRDEPAILAWELGNELRNPAAGKAATLLAWTADVSAYIRQADPNHLIADGGEGFDDDASLYPGLSNTYTVAGAEGCSYHRLADVAEVDMLSYHLYPAAWGMNDGADSAIYIRRHEEIARAAQKVAYFGEFGKRAQDQPPANCSRDPGRQFDPARAQVFDSWLQTAAMEESSAGQMVWQMINDAKDDCEGYQVYCPLDSASCTTLNQYAGRMLTNPSVTVSGASYRPISVASGSIASLFGSQLTDRTEVAVGTLPEELAGLNVAVVDGLGKSRAASLFFASASQINLLVPADVPAGGAVVRVYRNGTLQSSGTINIAAVEPGLFSAAADGKGLAAATAVTVHPDLAQTAQPVARYDDGSQSWIAVPVVMPADGGSVVLSLFGTGIRNAGGVSAVSATVNGLSADVLFAGAQPEYAGLDQVNIRLPAALTGAGEVDVKVSVAGKAANVVRVAVQ